MKLKLQSILYPHLAPAGAEGDAGGAPPVDRGDNFTPTDDDAAPEVKKVDAEPKVDTTDPEAKKDGEDKDEKGKKKEHFIPKSRFDEINQKAKAKEAALQAEIQKLREAAEANKVDANIEQIDAKVKELDEKYDDAMMDGDKAKAREIKAELRKYEKARADMVSHAYSAQAQIAAIEQYRYDNALDAIEAQYPVLNEANEDFDPEMTVEIADLMAFHQQKGMSKADALKKAALTLLGPPKGKETPPDANALRAQRSEEARKKAAEAIGKQPPDISKVGQDSDKLGGGELKPKDLLKMTPEQFSKLDEATLSRLRGDEFVGDAA